MKSFIGDFLWVIRQCSTKSISKLLLNTVVNHVFHRSNIDMTLFIPTTKCNLRCKGCIQENESLREMNINDFCISLEKAKKVNSLIFMGGEIVYKENQYLHKIFEYADRYFGKTIVLITNGTGLDRETVEGIARRCIIVFVSIDGKRDMHNKRRGDNVHQIVMNNIAILKEYKVLWGVITTVSKENKDEVLSREFIELHAGLGANFLIYLPFFANDRSGLESYELTQDEILEIDEFVDKNTKMKNGLLLFSSLSYESRNGGCPAGSDLLVVTPSGSVLCCPQMLFSMFNLSNGEFDDRLKYAYYKEIFDYTKNNNRACMLRNGSYKKILEKYDKEC